MVSSFAKSLMQLTSKVVHLEFNNEVSILTER